MNIAHWVARAGLAKGNRPALASGTKIVMDYSTMARRVAALAGALRNDFDLKQGERVAIAMHNHPAYVEILFAIWHAGLAAVPVNAKLHRSEFEFILKDSGACLCFVSPALKETISAAGPGHAGFAVSIDDIFYEELFASTPIPLQRAEPDDLAWLFYTSGTTGRPKGAMLSHRVLSAAAINYFADFDRISDGDCILHAAPLSHGSGLWMLPHVIAAACNIIPASGGFEPAEIFELIAHWPGLTLFAAPTMVQRLTRHTGTAGTTNLKLITYGGAPMYVEDLIAALDCFGPKLAQLYGQGESPMTITHLSREDHARREHPRWRQRLGSAGIADSIVEVAVAGPDGCHLPAGTTGEIICRGDTVMTGYWNNPGATKAALKDGWLFTGDMGVFDQDGYLTLTGRSKDLIISGGSNIYPREIEEVLLRIPGVAEVSVIGIPDPEWGEVVTACIVCEDGARIEESMLDKFCLDRIARFKRPRRYHFLKSLPKNNYGKVLKSRLSEKFS